jgi:hypothetical protein
MMRTMQILPSLVRRNPCGTSSLKGASSTCEAGLVQPCRIFSTEGGREGLDYDILLAGLPGARAPILQWRTTYFSALRMQSPMSSSTRSSGLVDLGRRWLRCEDGRSGVLCDERRVHVPRVAICGVAAAGDRVGVGDGRRRTTTRATAAAWRAVVHWHVLFPHDGPEATMLLSPSSLFHGYGWDGLEGRQPLV